MDNGKSLSQSTNRVVLREGSLIYAPEFIFWLGVGCLPVRLYSNFLLPLRHVANICPQFGKILAFVSNGWPIAGDSSSIPPF
jgi:hypothetical protein